MYRERTDELRFTVIVLDLILSLAAFLVAFVFRFYVLDLTGSDLEKIDLPSYVFFGAVLGLAQVSILGLFGFYRNRRFLSFIDEVGVLFGSVFANIIFGFAVLYFLKIYEISRSLPGLYGVILWLILLLGHNLFRRIIIARRRKGRGLSDLLIVGGNATALKTAKALEESPLSGFRVSGFVLETRDDHSPIPAGRILGTLDDLDRILESRAPGDLIYTGDANYQMNLALLMELCDRHGVQLHVVPSLGEWVTVRGVLENLEGLPLISVRDIPARTGLNRVLKRTFDILFSGVILLAFSWLYLLVALAVKLTSRGPVFFLQERVGLDNKVFRIIKFRTMKVQSQAESNTIWTTKNDPRITSIGHFLRRSSLDEIPQFINIFWGQMSVVGPRPERPFYVEQFKDQYQYFKRRHSVKAGLTGWAQIHGLRGDTSIQDRVDADIYYIENWSFFLDLKIVFLTPFKGMIHKNAY